ncbi:MAG: hypothetical protein GW898_10525 [Thiomicrospira sp.]|nr:hypothetical protein [Thiomicrospira sp.]NCO14791.1 hypothetical protein [Thiomicrospira sp.]NCO82387.1 hypothetical protein [Thiomicrospira sp.]OIP95484.1 MAG: hypothetical protein AUK56_05435 [Thiomicrospira sp. CG2_30_44_34]
MEGLLVKINNDIVLEQKYLDYDFAQAQLQKVIEATPGALVECLCTKKSIPLSIVADESGMLVLENLPTTDFQNHIQGCRFRKPNKKPLPGKPSSGEPSSGEPSIKHTVALASVAKKEPTKSQRAQDLLDDLWHRIESENLSSTGDFPMRWKEIKATLKQIAKTLQVNNHPLIENLAVVIPKPRKFFTKLDFPTGMLLIAELLTAKKVTNGSIRIVLKGAENPVWLSSNLVKTLEESLVNKITGQENPELDNAKKIILMSVVNSKSQKDVSAIAIGMIEVESKTFKRTN